MCLFVLSCPGQVLTLLCLRFFSFPLVSGSFFFYSGCLNTCSTKFNKQRTCLVSSSFRPSCPASSCPLPVPNHRSALRVRRPSAEAAGSLNLFFLLPIDSLLLLLLLLFLLLDFKAKQHVLSLLIFPSHTHTHIYTYILYSTSFFVLGQNCIV